MILFEIDNASLIVNYPVYYNNVELYNCQALSRKMMYFLKTKINPYPSQPYPLKCILSRRGGGRFMPAPSRLTIITVKNQNLLIAVSSLRGGHGSLWSPS